MIAQVAAVTDQKSRLVVVIVAHLAQIRPVRVAERVLLRSVLNRDQRSRRIQNRAKLALAQWTCIVDGGPRSDAGQTKLVYAARGGREGACDGWQYGNMQMRGG